MSEQRVRLTVLGCRGSMAASGATYAEFGGATSCYAVQAGNQTIVLDAGSGILSAPEDGPASLTILLSHWHLDHLIGLGMHGGLSRKGAVTHLYAPASSDAEALRMLDGIFAPPYWPLRLGEYPSELHVHAMPPTLRVGDVLVEAMEGSHPGGCLVYRLSCFGTSIVYATDYEHDSTSFARLAAFCQGASLVLYDGQYDDEDYAFHRGFGHSTSRKAVELKELSGAWQVLIVHHDPHATDDILRRREQALGVQGVRYAREGEVVCL